MQNRIFICVLLICSATLSSPSQSMQKEWRTPKLDDLVYMQTQHGLVIIELAPFMAPNHVSQFKKLVSQGFYSGLDFYRVIDGFVAQGGDVDGINKGFDVKPLNAEFSRVAPKTSSFQLEQNNDLMAPQTGYLHGFSAGKDQDGNQEWLLHCPGTVAMARGNEKNSATSDFYIVIGQATRHLDRNMSSFGKVIYGMPAVQAVTRASVNTPTGMLEAQQRSKIEWVKLASEVELKDRINVQIQHQDSVQVKQRLDGARKLQNPFFHYKGNGNLDMCYYQLKTRILE